MPWLIIIHGMATCSATAGVARRTTRTTGDLLLANVERRGSGFVIESFETLLPIEVKTANEPGTSDTKHVRVFREEYGKRCRPGLVLHTGESIEWLAPGILACPWWRGI